MLIIKYIVDVRKTVNEWKSKGFKVGFVPTMGYLHDGHVSLIKKARQENDKVVVSIFVNPIQFGPNEDYEKYPRNVQSDTQLCDEAKADMIFMPEVAEIYPDKNLAFVDIDDLGKNLCGAKREGHFRGVCTVVAKLFNIVSPDKAYFGEKDAQQLAIIKKMVKDLNFNIEIVSCPIIRENDGLAKSSRNSYLSIEQRKAALILNKSLMLAKEYLIAGKRDVLQVKRLIESEILMESLGTIDYVEIVDAVTLQLVNSIEKPILIAIAVIFGKTRLIDNFSFNPTNEK